MIESRSKNYLANLVISLCFPLMLWSQGELSSYQQTSETLGDVLVYTMPVSAFGSSLLWKDSQKGALQYTKAIGTTLALTLALKQFVKKERPDASNLNSFPSGHTAIAFNSASFMQKRFGWNVGLPYYALATYVGYTRIVADKHDVWDVLTGALIGTCFGQLFANPFKKDSGKFSLRQLNHTMVLCYSLKF